MAQFLYIYFAVFFVALFLFLFLTKKSKYNRHEHYQAKAKNTLLKINTFKGEYRSARIISYLRKINPFVFEELLLYAFEANGYKILRNKRYTGDGGIDGKLFDHNNKLILVQAKRYKSHINKQHVIEFSQKVARSNAYKGFFVHTGITGKGVYPVLTYEANVQLISGSKLINLLTKINSNG